MKCPKCDSTNLEERISTAATTETGWILCRNCRYVFKAYYSPHEIPRVRGEIANG